MRRVGGTWGARAARAAALAALALLALGCSATTSDATSDSGSLPVPGDRSTSSTSATTEAGPSPSPSATEGSTPAPGEALPAGRDVEVTSITDGDTFRAGEERVRLIGIDAPETATGPECHGREATEALTRLIPPGTVVRLERDVEATDRYGRTLAYVHRLDGLHVNLALARDGHASPLTIPPNVAYEDAFAAAAAEARAAGRGLWATCPDPTAPPTTATTAPGSGRQGCDPSYPTICVPPSPPDLDCGDITERDFVVLPPDPHRFDGGGDGLGCESDRG